MTDKGKKITVIVLGSVLGIVIYLSFKLKNDEFNEIMTNHHEVVGVISSVRLKTIDVCYSIKNNTYFYTQSNPYSGLAAGEEFYTLASTKDRSRALVFFAKPILDTTKYKFAVVNALNIDKLLIDKSELAFTYKVGVKKYNRIQKFEKGKRPNDTQKLVVKYRIDHPEIGYLVEVK